MPRTSRNTVEYNVNGVDYVIRFDHEHASDGKVVVHDGISVRHITTCRIHQKGNPRISVKGIALCSLKDEYDWQVGIKKSFQRALGKMSLTPKMPSTAANRIVATPQEVLYGLHMNTFFKEVRVRPDQVPPSEPPATVAARVVGRIEPAIDGGKPVVMMAPPATMNGTYHLGAD